MIKEPQQRSSRWVSTSIPQGEWDSPLALFSSAEYHVNNLVSPVLFHDGLSLVPANAVVVEIAPHALLQVCALVVILPSVCKTVKADVIICENVNPFQWPMDGHSSRDVDIIILVSSGYFSHLEYSMILIAILACYLFIFFHGGEEVCICICSVAFQHSIPDMKSLSVV